MKRHEQQGALISPTSRRVYVRSRRSAVRFRGVMLLEVIVAFGLLVFGMTMVGLQVDAGLKAAQQSEQKLQALTLMEMKVSELMANEIVFEEFEGEMEGDFGRQYGDAMTRTILYPGWSWQINVEPTRIENFYQVEIKIGYNEKGAQDQIENPDEVIEIDDEDTTIVLTAYRLFPKPSDINLQRDFGLTEEEMDEFVSQIDMLTGAMGDGMGGEGAGMTGESLSDYLMQMLTSSETGGFDPRMLTELGDQEYQMLAELLGTVYGRGKISTIRNHFMEQFQNLNNQNGAGGDQDSPEGPPGADTSDGGAPAGAGDEPAGPPPPPPAMGTR
jgi:hypothetical protein